MSDADTLLMGPDLTPGPEDYSCPDYALDEAPAPRQLAPVVLVTPAPQALAAGPNRIDVSRWGARAVHYKIQNNTAAVTVTRAIDQPAHAGSWSLPVSGGFIAESALVRYLSLWCSAACGLNDPAGSGVTVEFGVVP